MEERAIILLDINFFNKICPYVNSFCLEILHKHIFNSSLCEFLIGILFSKTFCQMRMWSLPFSSVAVYSGYVPVQILFLLKLSPKTNFFPQTFSSVILKFCVHNFYRLMYFIFLVFIFIRCVILPIPSYRLLKTTELCHLPKKMDYKIIG